MKFIRTIVHVAKRNIVRNETEQPILDRIERYTIK